jgi:hypothetical protein
MAFSPTSLLHFHWARDLHWILYELFARRGDRPAPPPHGWQDWTVTVLLAVVVLCAFAWFVWIGYLWRQNQDNWLKGIFGG